jgi:hypothetical protein
MDTNRRSLLFALASGTASAGLSSCATPAFDAARPSRLDRVSMENIQRWLTLLDGTAHLRSGSPDEKRIAALTERHFVECGFEVKRQAFTVPVFAIKDSVIRFDGKQLDVFPQHQVVTTPEAGVSAPLTYWRLGMPVSALSGRIAVVDLPHARHSQLMAKVSRESFQAALTGKPAAMVLITTGATGETIILNAPYKQLAHNTPTAVIGPKPGKDLIAAALAGKSATLQITVTASETSSDNLIATRDRGTDPLVFSTPRTAWTPAVAERGPGFAAFMELARWAPGALPERSLVFVQTTAHEYDNAGGEHFLSSALAPPVSNTALWVHLGAGFAGRSFHDIGFHQLVPLPGVDDQRYLLGTNDLVASLTEAFAGQAGLERVYSESDGAVGELAEILKAGYRRVFGLFGGHLYHHTMLDRIDKTDARWVLQALEAVKRVVSSVLVT